MDEVSAKEMAEKTSPGCFDPTGRECSKDYTCEIHYRVSEAIKAAYLRGWEECKRLLLECEDWLDEDCISKEFWTPAYREFRQRLQKATNLKPEGGSGENNQEG